jgi:TM2 domain-containing membrane protein YozV
MIALVLSGIFPGLGQLYNGQPAKGAIGLAAGAVLSWLAGRAMPADPLAIDQAGFALFAPLCALHAVWTWSIIDAWRAAGR